MNKYRASYHVKALNLGEEVEVTLRFDSWGNTYGEARENTQNKAESLLGRSDLLNLIAGEGCGDRVTTVGIDVYLVEGTAHAAVANMNRNVLNRNGVAVTAVVPTDYPVRGVCKVCTQVIFKDSAEENWAHQGVYPGVTIE
jgi:hypothetical protein